MLENLQQIHKKNIKKASKRRRARKSVAKVAPKKSVAEAVRKNSETTTERGPALKRNPREEMQAIGTNKLMKKNIIVKVNTRKMTSIRLSKISNHQDKIAM